MPIRTVVIGSGVDAKDAPLWKRIAAGALSGSLGQIAANPFDVGKVRLQADGRLKALGQPPRYASTLSALVRIPREEGFATFYRGLGPSVGRAAVINGCGIASYDQSKVLVARFTGRTQGLVPQVLGSLVSGLVSALVSTPFDVIKTRMMNQGSGGAALYTSALDCVVKTARAEGVLGLCACDSCWGGEGGGGGVIRAPRGPGRHGEDAIEARAAKKWSQRQSRQFARHPHVDHTHTPCSCFAPHRRQGLRPGVRAPRAAPRRPLCDTGAAEPARGPRGDVMRDVFVREFVGCCGQGRDLGSDPTR